MVELRQAEKRRVEVHLPAFPIPASVGPQPTQTFSELLWQLALTETRLEPKKEQQVLQEDRQGEQQHEQQQEQQKEQQPQELPEHSAQGLPFGVPQFSG
jgi:hypothetical protein